MKKFNKIFTIILLFISIIINFVLFNRTVDMNQNTKIIKQMSESTQVTDLNNQITELTKSHEEYAKSVEEKLNELQNNVGKPYGLFSYYVYNPGKSKTFKLGAVCFNKFTIDANNTTAIVQETGSYDVFVPSGYYKGIHCYVNDVLQFTSPDLSSFTTTLNLSEGDSIYFIIKTETSSATVSRSIFIIKK